MQSTAWRRSNCPLWPLFGLALVRYDEAHSHCLWIFPLEPAKPPSKEKETGCSRSQKKELAESSVMDESAGLACTRVQ